MTSFRHALSAAAVLAMSALVGTSASGAIIYQDSFSRAGGLNGTQPDVVNTGAATWSGVGAANVTVGAQAVIDLEDRAYLPFTPVAGNIYTLSADLDTLATDNHWVALGFGNSFSTGLIYVLSKGNGLATDAYFSGNFIDSGTASGTTGYSNYSIVLDTSNPFWEVDFYRGNTLELTIVHSGANPNPTGIQTVVLFTSGTADANVDNFTLSVVPVPEPASVALAAAALPLLVARRRR